MKLVKDLTRKYSGQGMVLLVVTVLSTVLGIAIIDLGRRIINLITNFSSGSGAGSRLLLSYSALMFAAIIIAGAVGYRSLKRRVSRLATHQHAPPDSHRR